MTLQDRINEGLVNASKEKEDRVRSGKFGASSFGKCIRAQVFNRLNVPPSEPFEIQTLHMFEAGKLVHNYIQQYFKGAECEVKVEDDHFIGYADLVLQDTVYDIKSVNPSYFFHSGFGEKRKTFNVPEIDAIIEKKKVNNILQVTDYALRLSKPKVGLVFFSRDLSYGIRAHEWISETYKWAHLVEEERAMLVVAWNKHKETGELPPAVPRLYDGKEKKYCQWRGLCKDCPSL